jgi:hypothetical protein
MSKGDTMTELEELATDSMLAAEIGYTVGEDEFYLKIYNMATDENLLVSTGKTIAGCFTSAAYAIRGA